MTSDEKILWSAIFADAAAVIGKREKLTRIDLVRKAAREADCMIAEIRRSHVYGGFGGTCIERGFEISEPEES